MSITDQVLGHGKTAIERDLDYEFEKRSAKPREKSPIFKTGVALQSKVLSVIEDLMEDKKQRNYHNKAAYLRSEILCLMTVSEILENLDIEEIGIDRFLRPGITHSIDYEFLMEALYAKGLLGVPGVQGPCCGMYLYDRFMIPGEGTEGFTDAFCDHMYLLREWGSDTQYDLAEYLISAPIALLAYPEFYLNLPRFFDYRDRWGKFVTPLVKPRATYRNTDFYGQVKLEAATRERDGRTNDRRVALDVGPFPHKGEIEGRPNTPLSIVPMRSWIPEQVRSLKPEHIVAIFPDAEHRHFRLDLGRGQLGPSGTKACGYSEPINHSHRTISIMLGEPQTGKSTLMNVVQRELGRWGFSLVSMKNLDERFGLGPVAEADIALKDDTNAAEIQALFKSATTKTFCSGGMIPVEEKGKDIVFKRARAVLMMSSNKFRATDTYDIDPGMRSRIRFLTTRTRAEQAALLRDLPEDHPWHGAESLEPDYLLTHLAKKFGVDPSVIFAHYLRICVDEFYASIPDHNSIVRDLETRLRNRVPEEPLKVLATGIKFARLLHGKDPNISMTPETIVDSLNLVLNILYNAKSYHGLTALREDWRNGGRHADHPWLMFRDLKYRHIKLCAMEVKKDLEHAANGFGSEEGRIVFPGRGTVSLTEDNIVRKHFTTMTTWSGVKVSNSYPDFATYLGDIHLPHIETYVRLFTEATTDLSLFTDRYNPDSPLHRWLTDDLSHGSIESARKTAYNNLT